MVSTLGSYGSEICKTPNLDMLAKDGLVFTNAYTPCPVCTPARASIQTGVYPFKHGMQTNIYTRGCMVHELPDSPRLLSRQLQSQGYAAGYTGKWHLGFGDNCDNDKEYLYHVTAAPVFQDIKVKKGSLPSDVGYYGDDFPGHGGGGERYSQYKEYLEQNNIELKKKVIYDKYPLTEEILSGIESTIPYFLTSQAIKHIEHLSQSDSPFFYMLNFWGPHEPYSVATKYVDMYRDMQMPKWQSFEEQQSNKPKIHNAHRWVEECGWEQYEIFLKYYYASVTSIDAEIGRLIKHLKDNDLYDNTIIIFSADHGESLGIHKGLTDKSFFMYEEILKVPLIIKGVDSCSRRNQYEDRVVSSCDFYSTILDYAGVNRTEAERDGLSLVPIVNGEQVNWRDCVVTESSGLDFVLFTQRMLRFEDMKYIFNCSDTDELYDLERDPFEVKNLIAEEEYKETLSNMRNMLAKWMENIGDGLLERYKRINMMK
jgi:arylsulfatase A-like enzyme